MGVRCVLETLGQGVFTGVWVDLSWSGEPGRGTRILSRVNKQMWNNRGREPRTGNGEKLDLEIHKFPITDKPLIPAQEVMARGARSSRPFSNTEQMEVSLGYLLDILSQKLKLKQQIN